MLRFLDVFDFPLQFVALDRLCAQFKAKPIHFPLPPSLVVSIPYSWVVVGRGEGGISNQERSQKFRDIVPVWEIGWSIRRPLERDLRFDTGVELPIRRRSIGVEIVSAVDRVIRQSPNVDIDGRIGRS